MADLSPKIADNQDGRLKKSKPISMVKVVELRNQGLSFKQIGTLLGYAGAYCFRVYQKFNELLPRPEILEAYSHNRIDLLNSTELLMLENLHDRDKLKDASLNNVAYSLGQVSNLRRLEAGQSTSNVGISIEAKLSKALDRSKDSQS